MWRDDFGLAYCSSPWRLDWQRPLSEFFIFFNFDVFCFFLSTRVFSYLSYLLSFDLSSPPWWRGVGMSGKKAERNFMKSDSFSSRSGECRGVEVWIILSLRFIVCFRHPSFRDYEKGFRLFFFFHQLVFTEVQRFSRFRKWRVFDWFSLIVWFNSSSFGSLKWLIPDEPPSVVSG